MAAIESTIRRHLLRGRHRGLLVLDGNSHEINQRTNVVNVNAAGRGAISIKYDGLRFTVASCDGIVKINNSDAAVGNELPNCCVITFGAQNPRKFVTFDVSNPEVMS
jgi:hypothetical protein